MKAAFILLLSLYLVSAKSIDIRKEIRSIFNEKQNGLCPNETLVFGFGSNPNGGKPPGPQPLTSCYWYKDSTCCTAEDDTSISASLFLLVNPDQDKKCYEQIHLLVCAVCSPAIAETGSETQTLCTDFCGKLYDACKGVVSPFTGGPILGGLDDNNSTTVPSKDEYCSAPFAADTAGCFNGASSFNFFAVALVAIACIFF